jgi:divinyl chlorophyllide a 8-vinyl-reductase
MTAESPQRPAATTSPASPKRVFMLGATGTIGQATVRALRARGHEVVCLVRARPGVEDLLPGATLRYGDACDANSLAP